MEDGGGMGFGFGGFPQVSVGGTVGTFTADGLIDCWIEGLMGSGVVSTAMSSLGGQWLA